MKYDDCIKKIQSYIQTKPLLLLGSGASVEFGLPTMDELKKALIKHFKTSELACKEVFIEKLRIGNDIEKVIDEMHDESALINEVRIAVWKHINKIDLEFFTKHVYNITPFSMSKLLEKLLESSGRNVDIITTNYDRIVEYAADIIGATAITGFEGSLIRKFELPSYSVKKARVSVHENTVHLWKVHGSLDWFKVNEDILSYPLSKNIIDGVPLIIPPSKDKFKNSYDEPYRHIITKADESIVNASSYLCIGYGFNDEHIQTKLLKEIMNRKKPIVVLAKKATEACRRHLIEKAVEKYIIIEEGETKDETLVTINGEPYSYEGSFWNLAGFLKVW